MLDRRGLSSFSAVCVGQFLAHQTALIFSALIPILHLEWRLTAIQAGLILGVFQFGQLAGYVLVGFLLDRMRSKPIMVWSAALVGAGDLLFALAAHGFGSGFALRLLGGLLLGGLYLPALKYVAETIPGERRGGATGIYVAVIVVAYAVPLFYVGVLAPRLGWRNLMAAVGLVELLGAVIIARGVADTPAPGVSRGAGFSRYVTDVLRNRPARRVILAYTGHNWELFGMWGWMTPFMVASLGARGRAPTEALAWGGTLAAMVIGLGGSVGALAGGRISDRLGRARAATLMLVASFLCSLSFGWLLTAPVALTVAVGLFYGVTALADSPSYSASLMETVPSPSLGGAFSVQMLFGWAATVIAPAAFGLVLDLADAGPRATALSWGAAFGILALGPLLGIAALGPLRDAERTGVQGGGGARSRVDTV